MIKYFLMPTLSICYKEWLKLLRDRLSLTLLIALPLLQFIIYGIGINVYPKSISTAVVAFDESPMVRQFVRSLDNSGYFFIKYILMDDKQAHEYLKNNEVVYIITIPENFTKDLIRNQQPHILAEFDASVPNAVGNSLGVLQNITEVAFARALQGPLHYLANNKSPIKLDIHANYNESLASLYSLVPRQIGIILVLLLTAMSSNTLLEEKTTGSLETLFKSPIKPLEIIAGLLLAYVIIGYVVLISSFTAMLLFFNIPMYGSFVSLLIASFPFILCNIFIGLTASSMGKTNNQVQQTISIYTMLSFLFSGFMFSFDSLPSWAKFIGSMLPMTHYINITTGIMLKGYTWSDISAQILPIIIFLLVNVIFISVYFRKRLD